MVVDIIFGVATIFSASERGVKELHKINRLKISQIRNKILKMVNLEQEDHIRKFFGYSELKEAHEKYKQEGTANEDSLFDLFSIACNHSMTRDDFNKLWKIIEKEIFTNLSDEQRDFIFLGKLGSIKQNTEKIIKDGEKTHQTQEKMHQDILEIKNTIQTKPESITNENYDTELKKYLESTKISNEYKHEQDNIPLYQYYEETKIVKLAVDSWDLSDDEADEVEEIFEWSDFLENNETYIVLGATFGVGKTSLTKMMAADLAEKKLNDLPNEELYIPVLIPLNKSLERFYGMGLDNFLKEIITPGENRKNKKILLIFDGLDEYAGKSDYAGPKGLLKKICEYRNDYSKIKAIITTRLEAGFPSDLDLREDDEYLRLLPFEEDQVKIFFEKYGLQNIDYFQVTKYDFNSSDIRKPLFCWMLALSLSNDPHFSLELKEDWNSKIKKSLLYMKFSNSLLEGKYKKRDKKTFENIDREKIILRKLAALKQTHTNNLFKDTLKKKLESYKINIDSENLDILLDSILTSYFHLNDFNNKPDVSFIHKTFQEYYLAEYYIECILEKKPFRINVGIPSETTLQFLSGLLELIKLNDDSKAKEYKEQFLSTFKHVKGSDLSSSHSLVDEAKVKAFLNHNCWENIHQENMILNKEELVGEDEFWHSYARNNTIYENVWIYRWISLFIFETLENSCEKIEGKKLETLVKNTSNLIPPDLRKLTRANLAGSNFETVDISQAEMAHIDLSGKSKLYNTNLALSNLRNANLANANLTGADLHDANLIDANLSGAILNNANLRGAKLTNANLSGASLKSTDLSDANLESITFVNTKTKNIIVNDQTVTTGIILFDKNNELERKNQIKNELEKIEEIFKHNIKRDNPGLLEV